MFVWCGAHWGVRHGKHHVHNSICDSDGYNSIDQLAIGSWYMFNSMLITWWTHFTTDAHTHTYTPTPYPSTRHTTWSVERFNWKWLHWWMNVKRYLKMSIVADALNCFQNVWKFILNSMLISFSRIDNDHWTLIIELFAGDFGQKWNVSHIVCTLFRFLLNDCR